MSPSISYFFQLLFSCHPSQVDFQAREGMLAQKLATLAFTILLLQRMVILLTQGICKEATLATRLHTNNNEGFWVCLKSWKPRSGPNNLYQEINIYLWFRTNKINKVDPFWNLINLVRDNNSTDVMNSVHDILPDVEGCDSEKEDDAWIVSQT